MEVKFFFIKYNSIYLSSSCIYIESQLTYKTTSDYILILRRNPFLGDFLALCKKFDLFIPPKLKGSLGTGTPILTPSIADLDLFKKYSEFCPTLVYMDAAFPYGFAFSISRASSKVFTLTMDKTGPNISSTTAASFGDPM